MTEVQESAESQVESPLAPDVRPSDVTEPAVWDDPASLRGELLTEEHLIEYAARLAHSHLSVKASSSARPLKKRFRETRGLIRKAYATLAEGAERKRDPSPAEVWLLDNSHVVEGQLREIDEDLPWGYLVKLPRMDQGPMRGYPLVYSLCLCYLRHTDCHVDVRSLTRFVDSYQSVKVLTIGELWAVPIMLRLGLVLAVGALALSEANAEDRDRADAWARRLLGPAGLPLDAAGLPPAENQDKRLRERDAALRELEGIGADERVIGRDERPSDAFLVTLLKRLRERDDAPVEALAWIARQTALLGTTPEELARRYHLRQAADQVSVGNAITSMRSINNLDWSEFFATTSYVEAILSRDPSGAYAAMDQVSRDRCRHAVERMARRSRFSETQIAEHALAMARSAAAAERCTAHVGYYLIDAGESELGAQVRYRPRLGARVLGAIERHPSLFYLTTVAVLTLGFAALAWLPLFSLQPTSWLQLLLLPAILLATSEIATAITNALVVTFVPPRLLPKYRFEEGIPAEHLTLVVVPTLLTFWVGLKKMV